MDTMSYIIGRNSAGGGSGSTPSWSEVTNKPFETVGSGLEVDNGALIFDERKLGDYVKTSQLATVATSGSYSDLSNKPTIPQKTSQLINDSDFLSANDTFVTATLGTGTEIGKVTIYGTTTTLYAPAGGGSTDWADITNKPAISAGTSNGVMIGGNTTYVSAENNSLAVGTHTGTGSGQVRAWVGSGAIAAGVANGYHHIEARGDGSLAIGKAGLAGDIKASGIGSIAAGDSSASTSNGGIQASGKGSFAGGDNNKGGVTASGRGSIAFGSDNEATAIYSQAVGMGIKANSAQQHVQGKYNIADGNDFYADIIGNGNSASRSNAEATDWSGNKYLAGNIYVGVTNWADPQNNSVKLANIPAPPTTAGTYTLQVVVDSDGIPTYSWI